MRSGLSSIWLSRGSTPVAGDGGSRVGRSSSGRTGVLLPRPTSARAEASDASEACDRLRVRLDMVDDKLSHELSDDGDSRRSRWWYRGPGDGVEHSGGTVAGLARGLLRGS